VDGGEVPPSKKHSGKGEDLRAYPGSESKTEKADKLKC
jgi:hypothetical protein